MRYTATAMTNSLHVGRRTGSSPECRSTASSSDASTCLTSLTAPFSSWMSTARQLGSFRTAMWSCEGVVCEPASPRAPQSTAAQAYQLTMLAQGIAWYSTVQTVQVTFGVFMTCCSNCDKNHWVECLSDVLLQCYPSVSKCASNRSVAVIV